MKQTFDEKHSMEGRPDYDFDIIGMIPAPGWYVIWEDENKRHRSPLVGWGIQKDGAVVPLTSDATGYVDDPTTDSTFKELYHEELWVEVAEIEPSK